MPIVGSIVVKIIRDKDRGEILKNHGLTQGWIISYNNRSGSDLGTGWGIEYAYTVNGKSFSRKTTTHVSFDACAKAHTCKKKRFWVIYSNDDYSKSRINFSVDIQGLENPEFPKEGLSFE